MNDTSKLTQEEMDELLTKFVPNEFLATINPYYHYRVEDIKKPKEEE